MLTRQNNVCRPIPLICGRTRRNPFQEGSVGQANATSLRVSTDKRVAKSFIYDHLPKMEYCDFPELKRLHGALSSVKHAFALDALTSRLDYFDRTQSKLKPVWCCPSSPATLAPPDHPLEAYYNITQED